MNSTVSLRQQLDTAIARRQSDGAAYDLALRAYQEASKLPEGLAKVYTDRADQLFSYVDNGKGWD